MVTNAETLKILASGEFGKLLSGVNYEADSVIRSQINQIPSRFFEPSISIDEESKNKISFMQFFAQAAGMSSARLSGYMEKYGIDPYDVKKIQGIVESIEVAREYGNRESAKKQKEKDTYSYGFSLSSHEQLSKAYV